MSYDFDAREQQAKQAKLAQDRAAAEFRRDVQEVMKFPAMRRVLWRFLSDANLDGSAYSRDPHDTAYRLGQQDAAGWWINAVRAHCPERETDMRAEARRAEKQQAREGDTSEEGNAS